MEGNFNRVTELAGERLDAVVDLDYHNPAHSFDVVTGIRELSGQLEVPNEKLEWLIIAGEFHDVVQGHGTTNEEESAEAASEDMKKAGYRQEAIDFVKGSIMATKLRRQEDGSYRSEPKNMYQEAIADADFRSLGTEHFLAVNDALRREMKVDDKKKWLSDQINFLEDHKYYTKAAESLWGDKKRENIQKLREKLMELSASGV